MTFIYPVYTLSGKGQTTQHIFDSEKKAKAWCDKANESINSMETEQVEYNSFEPTREIFLKDNKIDGAVTGFAWEKKLLE